MNAPKSSQQKDIERKERHAQLGIFDAEKLPTLKDWRFARDTANSIFASKQTSDNYIQLLLDEFELSYHSDEDKELCLLTITNHLLSLKFPGYDRND